MCKFYSRHGFSIPISLCLMRLSRREKEFIRSNCLKKVKFRSKKECLRRISSLRETSPERPYGFYSCSFCGGWHVTSHCGPDNEELSKRQMKRREVRKMFLDMGVISEPIPA